MATLKFWLLTCILATWAVVHVNSEKQHYPPIQSPTATVDCNDLIYNMAECLTFLTVGSNVTKPDGSCCSGLKSVLDADADCLCEALKSSANLGFDIDFKKAKALPSDCKVSVPPSLSDCKLPSAPGAPPPANPPPSTNPPPPKKAPAPKSPKPPAPVPPIAKVPPPTINGGGKVLQAPALSPVNSGAFAMACSSAVHFSVVVVSFLYVFA